MSTGNRCVIYDRIDALEDARTVDELVQMLRPILQELAYYGVTGEAAVLEAHEEWHDTYTRRLRTESDQDQASVATSLARAPAPSRHARDGERERERERARPSTSAGGTHSSTGTHSSAHSSSAARAHSGAHSSARASEPPSSRRAGVYTPARINATGLSQGLMSIMTGRHPSLGRDA
jgi:hypothetical protein